MLALNRHFRHVLTLTGFAYLAASLDAPAMAAAPVRDLDTKREFPRINDKREWQARAQQIREQALVSCGLWPLPEKTPLNARVFGKLERDGYSIEKVYFQTYPGFYLAGNLYRPLGQGQGPFPAILNPHGHWGNGRMADEKDGSIAARCINFARQGMIAFSYDMVGYNDTQFADTPTNRPFSDRHRRFATEPANLLWNVSLMGLQTWNSIRALDFLESLPDADRKRLACTGESGGGTQTFMLGVVDDRLAVQAPIVMVSHSMQGGCLCENAPGLRVRFSNMEIAAAAAPRPQILVAASGDWTKDTLTVEGPSIARMYELLNARDRFDYVRYDFGHNYNQTSREAVYGWFAKWLLQEGSGKPLAELPYRKEPDADLRVFADAQLPPGALTEAEVAASLKQMHRQQWQSLLPRTRGELKRYKEVFLPAWRHTLQLEEVGQTPILHREPTQDCGDFGATRVRVSRSGESEEIRGIYWTPKKKILKVAVVCSAELKPAADHSETPAPAPVGVARQLLQRGVGVLELQGFPASTPEDQFSKYFGTYNRTLMQERVRDLLTACAAAPLLEPKKPVALVGIGQAGLWALMAAPGGPAVVADCARAQLNEEQVLLSHGLFCPGIMNLGGFEGTAILAAPKPLLLHNLESQFTLQKLEAAYGAGRASGRLVSNREKLSEPEIADWVARLP